ncbi:MAG: transposase [Wenzhouxiangellaceae bacterium]|nr:transposase [Wenzhouxiangellaceae bacterium]
MSDYRRVYLPGGTFFFTVVTWKRQQLFSDEGNIRHLREAFRSVMQKRPFTMSAVVVMPDHLHAIWKLPDGDPDYSARWREIKKACSRRIAPISDERRERKVWQRRFWEHAIRDEEEWRRHVDYIHYNPVKHGLVLRASDWPWSSFRRHVEQGWYPPDWGVSEPEAIFGMDLE